MACGCLPRSLWTLRSRSWLGLGSTNARRPGRPTATGTGSGNGTPGSARLTSRAVLIAVAIKRTGEREVVGVDVGPAEDLELWRSFLRQLVERGLKGVRLVTSDAHLGLKQAVAEVLVGATWQRCRVHFMRNALATVPKLAQQMVAATLRTIFVQPDAVSAHDAVERICRPFEKRYPALVTCLQEAE